MVVELDAAHHGIVRATESRLMWSKCNGSSAALRNKEALAECLCVCS